MQLPHNEENQVRQDKDMKKKSDLDVRWNQSAWRKHARLDMDQQQPNLLAEYSPNRHKKKFKILGVY